jgi:Tol biopolymer transport system component
LLVASFLGTAIDKSLWSLPLPAGAPRRLAQVTGYCFAWSPDGRQLLFCKDSNLFLANADGTEAHLLLSPPDLPTSARFSPDSKRIRVTLANQKTGVPAIWELNRDGSNLHRLLPDSGGRSGECCGRWTADGRYYIFIGANNLVSLDPLLNVFALPDLTGTLRRTSPIPVQLTAGPLSFKAVLPSVDGKELFVLAAQPRGELVRYDTKTRQYVSFLSGISATDVAFSSDGKWVAYISVPDGSLWRSRIDGSERLQLTYGPARPLLPRWSPDGSQIAYSAAQLHEPFRIFLISARGGEPEVLLAEKYSEGDPTWSPAGTQIAFGRMPDEDEPLIQIADVKTRQTTVVPGSAGLFSPRWSPDGRYLAALTTDSKKLKRYDFGRRKWFDWISGESIGYPSWSADSRYVYFDTALTELTSFRRVGIGQTHSEPLFSLTGLRRYVGAMGTWSGLAPDGSPLFVRDISTQEIYALDVQFP